MSAFRCDGCEATFEHPVVDECASIGGRCEHLVLAGWRPVWVRVSTDAPDVFGDCVDGRPTYIFSRGGWICPACVERHSWTRPESRRPRGEKRRKRNYGRVRVIR